MLHATEAAKITKEAKDRLEQLRMENAQEFVVDTIEPFIRYNASLGRNDLTLHEDIDPEIVPWVEAILEQEGYTCTISTTKCSISW